jgi:IclR family pca regulon transcriptional regulator
MAEISSTGDQMLKVLETVAFEGPLSTAEIATICGMNRTIVHRLLSTLHARGYVYKSGKMFAIGAVVGQLAAAGGMHHLQGLALPIMQKLAARCQETVVLHRMDAEFAVVVEQAVSDHHLVRVQHRPGSRHPLYLGASGRVLLAFQSPAFINKVMANVEDRRKHLESLEDVRAAGMALSRNELQKGVHGIAVPLHDARGEVLFSLAVLVPVLRADNLENFTEALKDARDEIEAAAKG